MNFNQEKLNQVYLEIVNREQTLNNNINLNRDSHDDIGDIDEELKVLRTLSSNILKTIQYYKKQSEPKEEKKNKK